MLKFKIDQAAFDELPEALQAVYKPGEVDGETFFELQAEGKSDTDVTALKTALHKERKAHKELTAKLSRYGEHTIESIEAMQAELEDLKLQKGEPGEDEAKREEAIKERIKKALDAREVKYQRDLAEREKKLADLETTVKELTTKHRGDLLRRTIDSVLPETVHRSALDDILLNAQLELEYSDDANEGKGGFIHADSGVEVKDWLDSKLANKPHWLKPSAGGGERGSDPNAPRNPDRAASFKKAADANDIRGMIDSAPVV